jgi:hypothetical protein
MGRVFEPDVLERVTNDVLANKPKIDITKTPGSGVVPASPIITAGGSRERSRPVRRECDVLSVTRGRESAMLSRDTASSATPKNPVLARIFTYQFDVRSDPIPAPMPCDAHTVAIPTCVRWLLSM